MTLNLTELRDEPLGTPIDVRDGGRRTVIVCFQCYTNTMTDAEMALGDAADDESSFTFDVEGLGDEALDDSPSVSAFPCTHCNSNYCGLSDEALDPRPAVNAVMVSFNGCMQSGS